MLLDLLRLGCNLKGEFGVWKLGESEGRKLRQLKATRDFSIQSAATVFPEFQCQILPPHANSTPSPCFGVRVGLGGRNGTNRNVDSIFQFDFYTHHNHKPILHRLATIHNTADRETDKAIGIGRLCYSTGGLKLAPVETFHSSKTFAGYCGRTAFSVFA